MLFSFSPIDSFDIPTAEQGQLIVSFDGTNGTMVVEAPGQAPAVYPLIDDEAEPLSRVIFVQSESSPQAFQVGEVTYDRPELDVQYFPLNGYNIRFSVNAAAGHIGILDIRDNARELPGHHYDFDQMPTILSIEGNHLVVKTLQWVSSDPYGPWHVTG